MSCSRYQLVLKRFSSMVPTSPTAKRIYLTRHGQAEHNVAAEYDIADPQLTQLGREQSRELNDLTKDGLQKSADLLICSPLRRTMETMILGFPGLKKRLESEGKPAILLDILQEVGPKPCDTPTPSLDQLKGSNEGMFAHLDFSGLHPTYASKTGIFDPDRALERGKRVRHWLRDRPESEIVVVAHGDIMRCIAYGEWSTKTWGNAEVRVFTFTSSSDAEAAMTEIDEVKPPHATEDPTTAEIEGR